MSERTFRFRGVLGEGSFGSVHEAEVHEGDGFVRTLAVKCLHPRWSANVEYASRLKDEARLLGLLQHPAIVTVHGLARIDGQLAVLMERVDGADLSRAGRVPPRAALEIVAEAADALDAAWSATPDGADAPLNVVHRDIKPSNLMVTVRGAVKVMDFGVARARFDAREAETRSQQLGTARYMAPERWLDGVAEAPSDVFSLGVTLLELVTGAPLPRPRLSREGFEADLAAARVAVAHADVDVLIAEMCAFKAERRPSAADVCDRCRALARTIEGDGRVAWARRVVPTLRVVSRDGPRTGTAAIAPRSDPNATFGWEDPTGTAPAPVPPTEASPASTVAPGASPAPPRAPPLPWLAATGALAVAVAWTVWPSSTATMAPSATTPLATETEDAREPEDVPEPVDVPEPEHAPETEGVVEAEDVPEPENAPDLRVAPEPEHATASALGPARAPHSSGGAPPSPSAVPRPPPTGSLPAPPAAAPPAPEPRRVSVVFTIAEGLAVSSPHGDATAPRHALRLPANQTVPLTVVDGDDRWTCNILVGTGPSQVRIQPRDAGGCQQ